MWCRYLLVIGLVIVPRQSAAERFKWWQSAEVQRALRLTPKQIETLDGIFDASLPERRALRAAFDRYEFDVEQLLEKSDSDERLAVEIIDRLERARARKNVTRTMLLFHMRRVLTPAQRIALERIAAERH